MPISEILRKSADNTVDLLKLELQIRLKELQEDWHASSLEKIFIEQQIYKDKEYEQSKSGEEALPHVRKRLQPFLGEFFREVTDEDILQLFEIKMKRIFRFDVEEADKHIENLEKEMERVRSENEQVERHASA